MPRDLRVDHLPGDDFGRVSLVMDGRRMLSNFVLKKAEEVAEVLRRREADKGSPDTIGPSAR